AAGRPRARVRSGSSWSSTTSASLQANATMSKRPATNRNLDIVCSSTEKGARPPRRAITSTAGRTGLERRAQSNRECAEVRERERVHGIDGRRPRPVQLRASRQPDLGIEPAVPGDGKQVTPDHADIPITRPSDRTDVIGDEQLAELRVARILDGVAVGRQLVVEAADA